MRIQLTGCHALVYLFVWLRTVCSFPLDLLSLDGELALYTLLPMDDTEGWRWLLPCCIYFFHIPVTFRILGFSTSARHTCFSEITKASVCDFIYVFTYPCICDPYKGPFAAIVHSDKTFTVDFGDHWSFDRVKPAFVEPDSDVHNHSGWLVHPPSHLIEGGKKFVVYVIHLPAAICLCVI